MGLSAIATTLRRRKAPPGPTTTLLNFSRLKPPVSPPPPSPRKLRLKGLSADAIADLLGAVDTVATPEQAGAVADHITADGPLFADFIALLTKASASPQAPRDRLHRAWVVASLLRHGPPVLRDTLAHNALLIRKLASAFDAPANQLDDALAAHVADVLRVLFHEYPKETAAALYKTPIVRRLVAHINLHPAADLLPRFIGSRVFTSLMPAPIVVSHKRAIAMMGNATVQQLLADRFADAIKPALAGDREAVLVIEGCCNAMAEISSRAMYLPRKREDVDERADVAYAGNLLLVTAHIYNDAKDHMNLLHNTAPLLQVLTGALRIGKNDADVILPALTMVTNVLVALREARTSFLPSMRKSVAREDVRGVAQGLAAVADELIELLDEDLAVVGRKRLAVVDLLREACATADESCVKPLLCCRDFMLVRRLLELVSQYRRNDLLLVRVSQLLSAVFDRFEAVTGELLRRTRVAEVLGELKTEVRMEAALSSLVGCQSVDRVMQEGNDKLKRQLSALEEYRDEQMKTERCTGLVKGSGMSQSKISMELAKNLDLEGELSSSEDYGQEVYVHGLLDELSLGQTQAPPSDMMVGHKAQTVSEGLSKGLKRLKRRGPRTGQLR